MVKLFRDMYLGDFGGGGEDKGLRFNENKTRYDLLEPYAIEQLAKVFTFGARKYEDHNWLRGMKWSKMLASLKRHIAAFERGEDFDKESGLHHMSHAAWNANGLVSYYKHYPQGDDRRHSYLSLPKIGLDIDGVIADFTGHLLRKIGYPEHIPIHWNDPKIRKGFDEHKNDKQFWLDLPPLMNPKEINFEPHCYITARSIGEDVSKEWLDMHGFPTAPIYSIGIGESKVEKAKAAGMDVFVDDNFNNFVELNKAGILTYLYDAPYNQHYDVGYRRIKSLKELSL